MEPSCHTTDEDRTRYAGLMERIKLRVSEASGLLNAKKARNGRIDERHLLYAAAQLRLVIEETAYSSFVANRRAMEDAERSMRKNDWDAVTKALRAINPAYWPTGIEQVRRADGSIEWLNQADVLHEVDCARVRGRLSALLHARNPRFPPSNLREEVAFVRRLIRQLTNTLNEHLVYMVGRDELLCCQVWSEPVRVYVFAAVPGADKIGQVDAIE